MIESYPYNQQENGPNPDINFVPFAKDQGLLVFYNPTNERATRHAEEIVRSRGEWPANGPIRTIPTDTEQQANVEALEHHSKQGPFHIAVLGGDGTSHQILDAVWRKDFKGVTTVSADGYANDLAHSLHMSHYLRDPIGSLRDGSVGKISAVEVTITDKYSSELSIPAFGYFSIGVSGLVAKYFNSAEYRNREKPAKGYKLRREEIQTAMDYFNNAKPFIAYDKVNGTREIIDHHVLIGGRMAKIRWLPYKRILADVAAVGEIKTNNYKELLKSMGHMLIGGVTLHDGETKSLKVYSIGDTPLTMQIDGDTLAIASASKISYRISSEQPLLVAHTRFA
jgi:hypothetical protein